jgi:hypothetical protein
MKRLPNDFILNEGELSHSMGIVGTYLAQHAEGHAPADERLLRAACFWLEHETNDDDQETFLMALTALSRVAKGEDAYSPHVLSRVEAQRIRHGL